MSLTTVTQMRYITKPFYLSNMNSNYVLYHFPRWNQEFFRSCKNRNLWEHTSIKKHNGRFNCLQNNLTYFPPAASLLIISHSEGWAGSGRVMLLLNQASACPWPCTLAWPSPLVRPWPEVDLVTRLTGTHQRTSSASSSDWFFPAARSTFKLKLS